MKAIFSDKTRMAATLLTLFAVLCTAMPAKAQLFNGPKSVSVNAGIYSFVGKAKYSYDDSKITDKEQYMTPMTPTIGLNFCSFDYDNDIVFGTDFNINYVGFTMSHTFQNAHIYETSIQRKALDVSMQLYSGYCFNESFNVCLKFGFSKMLNISEHITQTIDGENAEANNFYSRNKFDGLANGFFIPITLSATYLFTEHWFVRGSLGTELINTFNEIGSLYFGNEIVRVKSSSKNISFVASFGYAWE
ncbi:MAG: hypothetical protein IKP89_02725 [Bacteroidales bacterium]|nr:hypothetical protein [Bacteroidales bacterium]